MDTEVKEWIQIYIYLYLYLYACIFISMNLIRGSDFIADKNSYSRIATLEALGNNLGCSGQVVETFWNILSW